MKPIEILERLIQEREAGADKGLLPDGLMNAARLAVENEKESQWQVKQLEEIRRGLRVYFPDLKYCTTMEGVLLAFARYWELEIAAERVVNCAALQNQCEQCMKSLRRVVVERSIDPLPQPPEALQPQP
jgi:hypothetical protein